LILVETVLLALAILAAPLLAGNNLQSMRKEIQAILTNRDVIAIDQEPAWKGREVSIQ